MNKLLIAAAGAAIAVPALAQVAPMAPRAPMAPMPRHAMMADGAVTLAELNAGIAARFARRDSNRDGALTKDELATGKARVRALRAAGGRDKMVRREGMADHGAMFDRLDANRDGMISRDEFAKGHEIRIERRVVREGQPGSAPMRMKRMGGGMMMGGHMFGMADGNNDGRVTLAEAQGAAARHFAMADTNRDGRVTREEMRAMHQQMRGKMAPGTPHHG